MNIHNVNSLTLNYKTLNDIVDENFNFNEFKKILKNDSKTIVTLETLKQLYYELVMLKNELSKEIEIHKYENNLLYYNNLVLTDCYTFKNFINDIVNISSLIYDTKTQSMNLDSYNTLLYSMSVYSNFSNIPNISNTHKSLYDQQYRYNAVHIPYSLPYTPMGTSTTKTITFNSSETQNFTIYTSNELISNIKNKANIFTEFMATEITNDPIYNTSQIFITVPTLINYKPETDNTYIYPDDELNKFTILKLCRLIDIPEIRFTYYYPGDTKLDPSSVLYNPCFMIPEQMTNEQKEEFLIEYTGSGEIKNGFINEENENIGGKIYNKENVNLSYMNTGEYKACYNFNEIHEDILNKSPIIEYNNKKYLLNKDHPYRCAIEYPAYLHYYFHDYFDFTGNNGGSNRRFNYHSPNLMDLTQVGIGYYEEETNVLCYMENNEVKLVKNRIYSNRYSTNNTRNTGHEYFTNITTSTPTFTQKMKIKHITYSFVISSESYQYHTDYAYKDNPTNEDLKTFSSTSYTTKQNGNRFLTIFGNSCGTHIYNPSNSRIASQTIHVFCPGINLDNLDPSSDRNLINDRKSLCVPEDYTGIVGEAGLEILDNANNQSNIEPLYGFGRKIKGGNPIENKVNGTVITDSRRCIEGIYFKLLLDVYLNKLNELVLIKRIKNKNNLNMFIKRNRDWISNFYDLVYNYPTSKFDINSINSFYECCYGLPYDSNAEYILYNYFIDKKFTKDEFEYSDKFKLTNYDFHNVEEIKEAIIHGGLYSDLVFTSNNIDSINNIYIASKVNNYENFKNITFHKYILFNFLNSESIKTIEVGNEIEKALIYFKSRDVNLIDTDFKNHEYRLEHIKHDKIDELVPEGEDDVDDYGFRYYRYIINPNAF